MDGITIRTETNFAAGEQIPMSERWVVARPPRFINLQRRLPLIHVTRAFHSEAPVNFVASVPAVSADQTVKAGSDCGHRILGFAENPHLDHISGFPVVAGGFKARGNDYAVLIFVKYVTVAHREPPLITVKR